MRGALTLLFKILQLVPQLLTYLGILIDLDLQMLEYGGVHHPGLGGCHLEGMIPAVHRAVIAPLESWVLLPDE